jgi:Fe-S-cluster containining protein
MTNCCLETKCSRCCINTNMILTYQDIETIKKLGYTAGFFVSEKNNWLQLKNNNGRCVFHNGTICTIYDQRPQGCILYPVVFEKDHQETILDSDCPQRHCFPITNEKSQQLNTLIKQLEKEREERKKNEKMNP